MSKADKLFKYLSDFDVFENDCPDSGLNKNGMFWHANTLIKATKKQKIKVTKLDLFNFNFDFYIFNDNHFPNIIRHFERVLRCDTSIPIIITPYGLVGDGYHRIIKTLLIDKKTKIKCYRLKKMPKHDEEYIDNKWVKVKNK